MILIADSGSTKTDWVLLTSPFPTLKYEAVATFHTQGITPIHQSPEDIRQILDKELLHQLSVFPRASLLSTGSFEDTLVQNLTVFFYGTGCTPEYTPIIEKQLREALSTKKVEVHSDLMAAARGLCQHEPGIACILGTGANSCLYDGSNIVDNRPALGFILGDEGSGAVLGKRFVNALYEGRMPADMLAGFEQATGLTLPRLIDRVYRQPMPNRFLASLAPFIHQQLHREEVRLLVTENFRDFLHNNILRYGRNDLPFNAVGSIAYHFAPQLHEAAGAEGVHIGNIIKSPMEGLMDYHRATAI